MTLFKPLTFPIALFLLAIVPKPATAATASCFKIQDADGWSNIRTVSTNAIVGIAYNGTTFLSAYTTDDSRILGGLGNSSLKIAISRTRLAEMSVCDNRYWVVRDRDGYANLRSAPNGSVTGRIESGSSVMILDTPGEWKRILTPNNRIGYIHSTRLYRD